MDFFELNYFRRYRHYILRRKKKARKLGKYFGKFSFVFDCSKFPSAQERFYKSFRMSPLRKPFKKGFLKSNLF